MGPRALALKPPAHACVPSPFPVRARVKNQFALPPSAVAAPLARAALGAAGRASTRSCGCRIESGPNEIPALAPICVHVCACVPSVR
eukprot:7600851-Pyramimonas_sp.AAC.1